MNVSESGYIYLFSNYKSSGLQKPESQSSFNKNKSGWMLMKDFCQQEWKWMNVDERKLNWMKVYESDFFKMDKSG